MTEKILFEFRAIQAEDGYSYKIPRGKRGFTLHAKGGVHSSRCRYAKTSQTTKRNLRKALDALENLYDELYPQG